MTTESTTSPVPQINHLLMAILLTIRDAGTDGAPEGPMYMAAMMSGYTLDDFQTVMNALHSKGLISRSHNVAYYLERKPPT